MIIIIIVSDSEDDDDDDEGWEEVVEIAKVNTTRVISQNEKRNTQL